MNSSDIFGTIAPPTGAPTDVGYFTAGAIRIFIVVAVVMLLIYGLWGAADWIISGGEKEKLTKAQQKITNAVIGLLLVVIMLAIFQVIAGNVLNIIELTPDGWKINLPNLTP